MANDARHLGLELRAARIRAGLTQSELGSRLAYGASSVSSFERGGHVPRRSTVLRWAEICSVDPEHLLNAWRAAWSVAHGLPDSSKAEAETGPDNDGRGLLLSIYVPRGRIYADEADTLLTLFRDWLGGVKNVRVHQMSYSTARGRVYELRADDESVATNLPAALADFTSFLDLAAADPDAARAALVAVGVGINEAHEMANRYGRQARRLALDIKQEHRKRVMSIAQSLESDLFEVLEPDDPQWPAIHRMIEALLPGPPQVSAILTASTQPGVTDATSALVTINYAINQQIVEKVEGAVIQGTQGAVHLGPQAHDLLSLIGAQAGDHAAVLESAVHALEDAGARPGDRLAAKQRLQAFLGRLGGRVGDAAVDVLKAYVESKLTA